MPSETHRKRDRKTVLNRRVALFARDEDGSLIIFSLFIFMLMLIAGGLSFDLMRFEAHRERLQSTLDRAVLAAASLTQTVDPTTVVEKYFEKAGMAQFLDEVEVTESVSSRTVTATASINVPLHHGGFAVFGAGEGETSTLRAEAVATAQEAIGNVEISMVLDVSGSMNSYGRIGNLKTAANDFLDTVYDNSEGGVSTSIIPYATQVNAGAELASYLNRADAHEFSHCFNFETSDFNSADVYDYLDTSINPLSDALEQSVHFDPFLNEYYGWDVGEGLWYPLCPVDMDNDGTADREIITWSTSKTDLQTYINRFVASGNTSTDIGTKWGSALLDPTMQPVLSAMVADGLVDAEMDGRPFEYGSGDAMKILVVMTDGAHTSQYYMDDYRSGDSFIWRYESGDDLYYSIWHDAEGSTPNTAGETYEATYQEQVCTRSGFFGCFSYTYVTVTETVYEDLWFVVYNTNTDGGGTTQYEWRGTPYDGDDDESDAGVNATRMTWQEVWAEIPPEILSDDFLTEMGGLTSAERNAYEYAISSVGSSTKDTRFDNICTESKNAGAIVFTIGLEVTTSNATRLRNCASSDSHYYDVENVDIGFAFQSIASQINQLRLTQ